ncbi:aminoglycoside phosphotransferase family protein [Prevotella sp. 10(H)]|uniref:aminoglycoside phosphotransferase family protein n=1 Tax=Prevotella sp. 10(H) TaxID=1158294 RepID=UPI0004A77B31|nr:aminoglycoside phosphotransferase family protein [Prevotella sp. 10(H)]
MNKDLNYYCDKWELLPDGESIQTYTSLLQPVVHNNMSVMLKIAYVSEEERGNKLMVWWNGKGAAQVFESDDMAILMERIDGSRSLYEMAFNGQDDEATKIICDVVKLLHSNSRPPFPELVTLDVWFQDLFNSATKYGGIFKTCRDIARQLLNEQDNVVVLHGDIHHKNILYSDKRGWLAIDPKGLVGCRAFDYVNVLCNPEKEIALGNGRLMKQISVISKMADIPEKNLLEWTIAFAGLSAIWFLDDKDEENANFRLEIVHEALKELSRW